MQLQTVTVLGSTGSVGVSTLDVIARHPDRYSVFALTANTSDEEMAQQCQTYQPVYAVMRDEAAAERLHQRLAKVNCATQVLAGESGLHTVVTDSAVQTVMAAIVGSAGLAPTFAAVQKGKKVLLANKEALVMAGSLFMAAVKDSGALLLPIDSEHNAIFQCLPIDYQGFESAGLRRILLTGSGGPFRTTPIDQLADVTPEQACKHPNWSMGRKISVDSATMMNKGLEFIEACWLFEARPEQIEVLIHPQSVVHSLVEYVDGSVLAQLGNPDMRTPIAHALAWPERMVSGVGPLDLVKQGQLDFYAPDFDRFPCLSLAMAAAASGGAEQTVLNAANEVAVAAFLEQRLAFNRIPELIEAVLGAARVVEPTSLEAVISADFAAREAAVEWLNR